MVKVDYEKAWKYTIHYWKKIGDLVVFIGPFISVHSQLLVKAKYSNGQPPIFLYLFLAAAYSIFWIFLLIATKIYSWLLTKMKIQVGSPFFQQCSFLKLYSLYMLKGVVLLIRWKLCLCTCICFWGNRKVEEGR